MLFKMSYYKIWKDILNMDMYELKIYLQNKNISHTYKYVDADNILCWKTKEEAKVVIEYLESIVIMQKLTK